MVNGHILTCTRIGRIMITGAEREDIERKINGMRGKLSETKKETGEEQIVVRNIDLVCITKPLDASNGTVGYLLLYHV